MALAKVTIEKLIAACVRESRAFPPWPWEAEVLRVKMLSACILLPCPNNPQPGGFCRLHGGADDNLPVIALNLRGEGAKAEAWILANFTWRSKAAKDGKKNQQSGRKGIVCRRKL